MSELAYTVILLGVLQGAVLSVVLARRPQNRLANRVLAGLVAALALMLLLEYLDQRWGQHGHPHLIALGSPLPYLFSPLLYLYVVALTTPLNRLRPRSLIHGVPFLANLLFMLQAFYFKSAADKQDLVDRFLAGDPPTSVKVMQAIMVIQAVAYMTACVLVLRKHGRTIRDLFSDLHDIDLRWLTVLVFGNAAVWIIVAVAHVLQIFSAQIDVVDKLRPAIQLGSALIVFLVGYISLWQPELFARMRPVDGDGDGVRDGDRVRPAAEVPVLRLVQRPRVAKYQRNRLDPDEAAQLAAELEQLMADKQMYRNPGLTLQLLADALGVPAHTLSQVLNVHIGKSFYAYVNGQRAEALMTALAQRESADQQILQLALDAGFNSKSTANGVFKKHTGLTPSQFRARHTSADRAAASE